MSNKRLISRVEVKKMNLDYVQEIFDREPHNKHRMVITDKGTLRWESDPVIDMLFEHDCINLNDLFGNGASKNDPLVREFYRRMGYSLFGYWEMFHWEANNPDFASYREDNV